MSPAPLTAPRGEAPPVRMREETRLRRVVKIMTEEEWENSLGSERISVSSSENDVRDGSIHCASAEQGRHNSSFGR